MYPNCSLLFLLNSQNKVLLLKRINSSFGNNAYSLPGGKIEPEEPAQQAVIREAREELNINLKPENLQLVHLIHRKIGESTLFACVFQAKDWEGVPTNKEPDRHGELAWFALDNLPENLIPVNRRAIELIQQGITYSEDGW